MRRPLPALIAVAVLHLLVAAIGAAPAAAGDAPAGADTPRFLLLIHGGEAPAERREAVVDAYRQWARRLAAEGRLVEADELAEEAVVLSAGEAGGEPRRSPGVPSAGGYFLIAAADLDAALAIAGDCPALRHGGAVEVVAIRRN